MSRVFGLDRRLGVLTGGATAICGASAAIAIAAVGLKTSLLDIRKVGPRAALLLGSEALFLVGLVLLVQKFH
jgi:uncharacterized membrane protein YadS